MGQRLPLTGAAGLAPAGRGTGVPVNLGPRSGPVALPARSHRPACATDPGHRVAETHAEFIPQVGRSGAALSAADLETKVTVVTHRPPGTLSAEQRPQVTTYALYCLRRRKFP